MNQEQLRVKCLKWVTDNYGRKGAAREKMTNSLLEFVHQELTAAKQPDMRRATTSPKMNLTKTSIKRHTPNPNYPMPRSI